MAEGNGPTIKITVDSSQAEQGLKKVDDGLKKVGGAASSAASSTNAFSQVMKSGAGAMLGFAGAAGAITLGVRKAINATAEQQKVAAQLNAVLKSTQYAAGLTAKQLTDMASGMQKVTTYGDEAILSSSNLLLTFKSIGSDIFPRAQKAILDVSTAMGQDLKSSTIQIGKALNSPIEGLAALSRVGIQFTDTQKEMIKSMVNVGNIAGAQTLILKELESQFEGSAEAARNTLGGALEGLSNAFDDLFEIDSGNLGVVTEGINALANNLDTLAEAAKLAGGAIATYYTASLINSIKFTALMGTSLTGLSGAAGVATVAMRGLSAAMAFLMSPGVILAGLGALTVYAYQYAEANSEVARTQEQGNAFLQQAAEINIALANTTGEAAKQARLQRDDLIANAEAAVKNAEAKLEIAKAEYEIAKARQAQMSNFTLAKVGDPAGADAQKSYMDLSKSLEQAKKNLENLRKEFDKGAPASKKFQTSVSETTKEIKDQIAQLRIDLDQKKRMVVAQKQGAAATEALAVELEVENALREAGVKAGTEQAATIRQLITERAKEEKSLKQLTDAQKEQEKAMQKAIEQREDLLNKPLETFLENTQNAFADTFKDIFRNGVDGFSGFFDRAKDLLIDFVAETAALMIFRPIIAPQVIGGAATGGGLGSVFSGSGGGISGLSNLFSGGSSLSNILSGGFSAPIFGADSFIGGGINSIGNALGIGGGYGPSLPGSTFNGLNNAFTPASAIGGFAGNFLANSLFGDRGIGASIGGTLGGIGGTAVGASVFTALGSAAGPVGALVGSFLGNAIGGLFGGKPSDKTQGGQLNLSTGTIERSGFTGKKYSKENEDAVTSLLQFASAVSSATGGTKGATIGFTVGDVRGKTLYTQVGSGKNAVFNDQNFKDTAALLKETTLFLAKNAAEGVSQDLLKAVEKIDFSKMEKAIADIQFAANLDNLGKAPEKLNLMEEAVKELNAIYDKHVETAERLGLAESKVEKARERSLKQLREGLIQDVGAETLQLTNSITQAIIDEDAKYRDQIRSAAAIGADTTLIELNHKLRLQELQKQLNNEQLTALNNQAAAAALLVEQYQRLADNLRRTVSELRLSDISPISLENRLAEARGLFDTTKQKALAGDMVAAEELDDVGKRLIELSRQFNASTTAYVNDFSMVEAGLNSLRDFALGQVTTQTQVMQDAQAQATRLIESFANPDTNVVTLAGGQQFTRENFDLLRRSIGYTGEFGGGKFREALAQDPMLLARYQAALAASGQGSQLPPLPGFARGGVVPGNRPFLVGENGPEVFSSGGGGRVTPIADNGEMLAEMRNLQRAVVYGLDKLDQHLMELNASQDETNSTLRRTLQ